MICLSCAPEMGLARRVVAVGQGFPSFPRDGLGLVVPSGKRGWSFSEPATLGRREHQAWIAEFLSVAFVFVFVYFSRRITKTCFSEWKQKRFPYLPKSSERWFLGQQTTDIVAADF